ncbi:WDR44 family WD repeat protein [Schizosaccharomyces cryophilus OY26]|uniref:WDR44 family WD repeat protein n=1 Tax=Schizosaccharomyces cryophilus (strain OY26 / ATCC MYA-4695 / CBS 11777 / NBRC 106824 / NRRL Y48691) TaxID=653667 RepID=S9VWX1_SCHCR|nr:WDR44 family WD repeat protein [Schizosaccharomyces cryophilus OY26]EPY50440.1 WDR44 family WD repeat protein [Schizosaccharomyces cryophilus OY26]
MNDNLPHIKIHSPDNSFENSDTSRQDGQLVDTNGNANSTKRQIEGRSLEERSSSARSHFTSSTSDGVNNSSKDALTLLDPLSQHILNRTRSSNSPSKGSLNNHSPVSGQTSISNKERRNKNDISPAHENEAGNVNLPSIEPNQPRPVNSHRSSIFSRVLGNKSNIFTHKTIEDYAEDDDRDALDGISRVEGNAADPFSWIPKGKNRWEVPSKYIRVRSHKTKQKSFAHLFLAQELHCKPAMQNTYNHYYNATPDPMPSSSEIPRMSSSSDLSSVPVVDDSHNNVHISDDNPYTDEMQPDYRPSNNHRRNKSPSVYSDSVTQTVKVDENPVNCAIWAMRFSRDGRYLAVGGQDNVLRVWQVLDRDQARKNTSLPETRDSTHKLDLCAPVFSSTPVQEYAGHTADILDISWSKNNFLLSSSMDRTVRLWHPLRKDCLCCFEHSDFVTSIAFHPKDDRFFLSGSLDCKLRLWSIKDKNVAYWNELPELITAVAFSPDGSLAIAGTFVGLCLFYDTRGLRFRTQIHIRSSRGKNSKGSKITGIETRTRIIENIAGDTEMLVTTNDSRIRIYNLRDKSLEIKFKGHLNEQSQNKSSFDDELKHIICGSEDHQVYIWDIPPPHLQKSKKKCYEHFKASMRPTTTAIFAPSRTKQILLMAGDPLYTTAITARRSSVGSNTSFDPSRLMNHLHSTRISQLPPEVSSGHIIVCGDMDGRIRVFRQDSSFEARNSQKRTSNENFSLPSLVKNTTNSSSLRSLRNKSFSLNRSRHPSVSLKQNPVKREQREKVDVPKEITADPKETHLDMDENETLKRVDMMMLQEGASSMAYYSMNDLDVNNTNVSRALNIAMKKGTNTEDIDHADPVTVASSLAPRPKDESTRFIRENDRLECSKCGNFLFYACRKLRDLNTFTYSLICSHCGRKLPTPNEDDNSGDN